IGTNVEVPGFFENLTAREKLLIKPKNLRVNKKKMIKEALENVYLHKETKKHFGKYSLVMKYKNGIGKVILHNSELQKDNKRTNGLDPIGIKEIRSLILSLAKDRNITIFVSSHILSEIEQLATHMGIIHEGRLLEEIAFDKLRERNRNYLEFQVSDDNKAIM